MNGTPVKLGVDISSTRNLDAQKTFSVFLIDIKIKALVLN